MSMHVMRVAGVRLAACLFFLLPAFANAADQDGITYQLTEKKLGQYERATEAMYEFMRAHPELRDAMEMDDSEVEEVTDTTRIMDERAPGLRKVMEESGMTMEDYFTFTMTLAGTAFGLAIAEQFGGIDDSKMTAAERANLEFLKKYQQRFEQFSARMEQKYGDLSE